MKSYFCQQVNVSKVQHLRQISKRETSNGIVFENNKNMYKIKIIFIHVFCIGVRNESKKCEKINPGLIPNSTRLEISFTSFIQYMLIGFSSHKE